MTTDNNKSLPVSIYSPDKVITDFSNPFPVVPVGSAADKDWDDLILARDSVTQDITSVTYKKSGVTVRVLTFIYDAFENLIEVIKS